MRGLRRSRSSSLGPCCSRCPWRRAGPRARSRTAPGEESARPAMDRGSIPLTSTTLKRERQDARTSRAAAQRLRGLAYPSAKRDGCASRKTAPAAGLNPVWEQSRGSSTLSASATPSASGPPDAQHLDGPADWRRHLVRSETAGHSACGFDSRSIRVAAARSRGLIDRSGAPGDSTSTNAPMV